MLAACGGLDSSYVLKTGRTPYCLRAVRAARSAMLVRKILRLVPITTGRPPVHRRAHVLRILSQRLRLQTGELVFSTVAETGQAPSLQLISQQLAGKVFPPANGGPQALKRKPIFSDLAARPRSCPSLFPSLAAFFRSLLDHYGFFVLSVDFPHGV